MYRGVIDLSPYALKTHNHDSVYAKPEDIVVGGTNLVRNSATLPYLIQGADNSDAYGTAKITITRDNAALSGYCLCISATGTQNQLLSHYMNLAAYDGFANLKVKPLTYYTISYWCKFERAQANSSLGNTILLRTGIDVEGICDDIVVGTEWTKIVITKKTKSSTYNGFIPLCFYSQIRDGYNATYVGDKIYIRDLKIEEGTRATTWSPCPLDSYCYRADNVFDQILPRCGWYNYQWDIGLNKYKFLVIYAQNDDYTDDMKNPSMRSNNYYIPADVFRLTTPAYPVELFVPSKDSNNDLLLICHGSCAENAFTAHNTFGDNVRLKIRGFY